MLEDRINYALMAAADRARETRQRSELHAASGTSRPRRVARIHWLSRGTAAGRSR